MTVEELRVVLDLTDFDDFNKFTTLQYVSCCTPSSAILENIIVRKYALDYYISGTIMNDYLHY